MSGAIKIKAAAAQAMGDIEKSDPMFALGRLKVARDGLVELLLACETSDDAQERVKPHEIGELFYQLATLEEAVFNLHQS